MQKKKNRTSLSSHFSCTPLIAFGFSISIKSTYFLVAGHPLNSTIQLRVKWKYLGLLNFESLPGLLCIHRLAFFLLSNFPQQALHDMDLKMILTLFAWAIVAL